MTKGERFQWSKGENYTSVETYKETINENNTTYICFESGRRVSMDVFREFLIPIGDKPIMEQVIDLNSYIDNQNILDQNVLSRPPINSIGGQQPVADPTQGKYNISNLLLDQLKKKSLEITIDIKIPILKKELFFILQESYPDIFDDLTKTIVNKYISTENIYLQLSDKLKEYYQIEKKQIEDIIELDVEIN